MAARKQPKPELHQILAALGDPIRLDILRQLAARDEVPCGGFGFELAKSTLSHHFKVLRESGVVAVRCEGTSLMNYLDREAMERHFPGLLDSVLGKPARARRKSSERTVSERLRCLRAAPDWPSAVLPAG